MHKRDETPAVVTMAVLAKSSEATLALTVKVVAKIGTAKESERAMQFLKEFE